MNRVITASLLLLTLANGKPEPVTDYHKDEVIKSMIEYRAESHTGDKKGVKEGLEQVYFRNGKLSHEVAYVDGKMDGDFKQYDREGNLREVMHYKNGVLDGPDIQYIPMGLSAPKSSM